MLPALVGQLHGGECRWTMRRFNDTGHLGTDLDRPRDRTRDPGRTDARRDPRAAPT